MRQGADDRAARSRPKTSAVGSRSKADAPRSKTLSIAAECMVSNASSLKEQLIAVLGVAPPVTLDISALTRIDTAGMQLIAAFVRERSALGLTVKWRGSAPVFADAARLLGLTHVLGLPA